MGSERDEDGYFVASYLGIVSATVFFEDEDEAEEMEQEALEKIESIATSKFATADAVIGIKTSISSGGSVSKSVWCNGNCCYDIQ